MAITINGSGITSANIADGTIVDADLANNVITEDKIAAATVSNLKSGRRNRIINGDMKIDQRNAGASVTPVNGTYSVDRWVALTNVTSKFSMQQNAGAVTPPEGFSNYLGVTSLSAYAVASGEYGLLAQKIEGYNTADLNWGTAAAKTVTISFWVRSSLTGTFGSSLRNNAANRSYPFTYTISSADTWEYKTVLITGDTTGTWVTDSGVGINLYFGLGAGSTFSGTAGAWAAANYLSATGATSVVGTSGATFYITGVQLEAGSTATDFEHRSYGTELALCQRYYQEVTWTLRTYSVNGYLYYNYCALPVTMRAIPTASTLSTAAEALVFASAFAPVSVNSVRSGFTASGTGDAYIWQRKEALSAEL